MSAPASTAPSFLAAFDSASVMTMATATALHGQPFRRLGNPAIARPAAKAVGRTPRKLREKLYIAAGAMETVSPRRLGRVDPEEIGDWIRGLYPDADYPMVAIGSSNGALTQLYASMRIPWLPQTFLVPVRQRVHPDDPTEALEKAHDLGQRTVEQHPDLQLHHMHDANQDRLMVRALTYFRFKRRTLGEQYERFLRDRLQPGGTILLVDCRQSWGTTRLGDRHVFQHGAVGGATEQEFHEGSDRVADYLDRYDSPVRRWDGPEPDGRSPEAEWGFEPALADDVERFAAEHGYRVERIVFEEPMDTSPFVADLHREWHRDRGLPADRLVVSSFVVMDPWRTLQVGGTPFWLQFNMEPSVAAIERYLDDPTREPFDEIHLALFEHGVEAVGIPDRDRWKAVVDRATRLGRFLDVDIDEFPLAFDHLARYDEAMEAIPARHPVPPPLPWEDVVAFLEASADRYAVRLER